MPLFTRTRTNPIFYRDRLEALLGDEPDRLERIRTEPGNLDLLTWNVFASLDTHEDQEWLAYRLQELGGANLRAPVRISLFAGARRTPYLQPSTAYLQAIHQRSGVDHTTHDRVEIYERPIEVPVRIETPDVLLLVDTARDRLRAGAGGRDRLAELTDAGLEHARRLGLSLSLAVVANDGGSVLSSRLPQLSDGREVARLLPWRTAIPPVTFHGVSWTAMARVWREEQRHLDLDGQPVRAFQSYVERAPT
jgi:hypothetical protein